MKEKKEARKVCKKLPPRKHQGNYSVCVSSWLDVGLHRKEHWTEPIFTLWHPSMKKVREKAADPSLQMNPDIIA